MHDVAASRVLVPYVRRKTVRPAAFLSSFQGCQWPPGSEHYGMHELGLDACQVVARTQGRSDTRSRLLTVGKEEIKRIRAEAE